MPPIQESQTSAHSLSRRLRYLLLILGLCLTLAVAFFWYQSREQNTAATQPTPITLTPFTANLILSLTTPARDAEGIPYSGLVHYNPTSQVFSYIASSDDGVVQPVGSGAFTSGSYFMAQRLTGSSSDLMLYNKSTLTHERTIAPLSPQYLVGATLWSQNTDMLAYYIVDTTGARVVVESTTDNTSKTLPPWYPIGFSSDATQLLVRSVPTLSIVTLDTEDITPTTGSAFIDTDSRFELSPSGEYVVARNETQIDWHTINWATGDITHVGSIPTTKAFADVLFAFDNTLLVREEGSDLLVTYEYLAGEGVRMKFAADVNLPEGALILKSVSW